MFDDDRARLLILTESDHREYNYKYSYCQVLYIYGHDLRLRRFPASRARPGARYRMRR